MLSFVLLLLCLKRKKNTCHGDKAQGQHCRLGYWICEQATTALLTSGDLRKKEKRSIQHHSQTEVQWCFTGSLTRVTWPWCVLFPLLNIQHQGCYLLLSLSHTLCPLPLSLNGCLSKTAVPNSDAISSEPLSIQPQTPNKRLGNHITLSIWSLYCIRSANTQL